MLDTVDGLPPHPPVVHGVVVLLPLAVTALVVLQWRSNRADAGVSGQRPRQEAAAPAERGASNVVTVTAVAAVVVARARGVQVHRVGGSGARAARGDTPPANGSP